MASYTIAKAILHNHYSAKPHLGVSSKQPFCVVIGVKSPKRAIHRASFSVSAMASSSSSLKQHSAQVMNGDIAFPNGELSTEQLLEAQAHIWNQIFTLINSMSLKYAVQLGIPDVIHSHGKPITLSELVERLPVDKAKSQCIGRLMRVLVHSKFFVEIHDCADEEKMCYWLTPASRLLFKDAPLTVAPVVLLILDPILTKSWDHMSEWLTDKDHHPAPFEMAHNATLWEKAQQEPRLNWVFNEAMASDSRVVAHALIRDYKHVFRGIKSLVDVGGGTGTMAKAIADAFPHIKCSVLELPYVVAGLEGTDNVTYIQGDMFESIPSADAVLLKWMLHDWKDEDSLKILKKCKDAIPSKNEGGKVMIIDVVVDINNGDDTVVEDQLFLDMAMMAYLNGKERSEKEWAKLFSEAGFTGYKITPAFGVRSLIEVYY